MAERPDLRPEKRAKYRFGERQALRAAGFRRAGAVACCWQVTRSARRGQGRRRPSPGPDGGCSLSHGLRALQPSCLRARIAPSRPAPSAPATASVRRPSEPPLRRDGGSMADGLPMAGWGRCNFWKMSEVRRLAARNMLKIGESLAFPSPISGEGGPRSGSDGGPVRVAIGGRRVQPDQPPSVRLRPPPSPEMGEGNMYGILIP